MFGATRIGIAETPKGASFAMFYGVAVLCGIGFTISLLIGALAFNDPAIMTEAKVGIIVFVHNARRRGRALLGALIAGLVA